jgi:hypothetical protein
MLRIRTLLFAIILVAFGLQGSLLQMVKNCTLSRSEKVL